MYCESPDDFVIGAELSAVCSLLCHAAAPEKISAEETAKLYITKQASAHAAEGSCTPPLNHTRPLDTC